MNKENIKYNLPQLSLNISSTTYFPGTSLLGSHYHSAIELVYVHAGKLACKVEQSVFNLSANEVLLINKNIVHYIECLEFGTDFSYIQIELSRHTHHQKDDALYNICQFIDKTSRAQYCISTETPELLDIFNNIFNEFNSQNEFMDMYLQAYILHLVAFMHRYKLIEEFDSRIMDKIRYAEPIIQFIDKNYANKIYLDELASIIKYNKFQLCKYFKTLTGGTVVEYINFVRLQHASDLLLNSQKSVSEIAFDCGFSSLQYFNKIFKQNLGCSPSKYKNLSHI